MNIQANSNLKSFKNKNKPALIDVLSSHTEASTATNPSKIDPHSQSKFPNGVVGRIMRIRKNMKKYHANSPNTDSHHHKWNYNRNNSTYSSHTSRSAISLAEEQVLWSTFTQTYRKYQNLEVRQQPVKYIHTYISYILYHTLCIRTLTLD